MSRDKCILKILLQMNSEVEKLRIVEEELALETHNGTTKADLLMLLDWAYNRLIKGDLEA